jgi:ADP-heptose:LPS heptosyltransferase
VFAYRGLRRDVRAGRFAPVFVFAHATHYRKRIGGCAPVFAPDLSPTASGHTAERTARAVLRALSLPEEETPAPTVDVPEDPAAVERLRGLGVALEHDRFLLVHAGSNRVTRRASHRHRHEKRWPLASFLAVADRVLEAFPDAKVVLVGTREEGRWMAPELAERGDRHGRLVDLCGETAISDLLQLLRRAALLLCNDSGVMHLASVVRTPLVALFGPTDEGLIGPFRMEDRACLIRALPFEDALEHHDCMERIAVERVYDEVARRLP